MRQADVMTMTAFLRREYGRRAEITFYGLEGMVMVTPPGAPGEEVASIMLYCEDVLADAAALSK